MTDPVDEGRQTLLGRHAATLVLSDGSRLPAELELEANARPHGRIWDWPVEASEDGSFSFPGEPEVFSHLSLDLRSNVQITLVDVTVSSFLFGVAQFVATSAVAGWGLDISEIPKFARCELQISGVHRIFGTRPLKSVTLPTEAHEEPYDVSATIDPQASQMYEQNGTSIECGYGISLTPFDPFHFEVRSRPSVIVETSTSLAPAAWLAEWIEPLQELVSLATASNATTLFALLANPSAGDLAVHSEFRLFAPSIQQAEFVARRDPLKDGQVLFLLTDLPYAPLELVERWRTLRQEQSGFVHPLMQALTADMKLRSRFLWIVQALEGFHVFTVGEGAEPGDVHKAKLKAVLTKAAVALDPSERKWLRRFVDGRGSFSLEQRLSGLVSALPEQLRAFLKPKIDAHKVATMRNKLSHGSLHYDNDELRAEIRPLLRLALASMLIHLELPTDRFLSLIETDSLYGD